MILLTRIVNITFTDVPFPTVKICFSTTDNRVFLLNISKQVRANIPAALNASCIQVKQLVITVNMLSITDRSVSNSLPLSATNLPIQI